MKKAAQNGVGKNADKVPQTIKMDDNVSPEGFIYLTEDFTAYNRAEESIIQKLLTDYPVIPLEYIKGELPEFDGDGYRRRLLELHPIPLIPPPVPDPANIVLPPVVEAEVLAMAQGVNPEDEDQALEIEAAQVAFREARQVEIWQRLTTQREEILSEIELQKVERNELMKDFVKTKPFEQAKHLLVKKWPKTEAISLKIQQHPEYHSIITGTQQTSIYGIPTISRRLFSDTEQDPHLRIEHAREHLKFSVKMASSLDFDAYVRRFNEARRVVVQEGGGVEQTVLIQYCLRKTWSR